MTRWPVDQVVLDSAVKKWKLVFDGNPDRQQIISLTNLVKFSEMTSQVSNDGSSASSADVKTMIITTLSSPSSPNP